MPDDDHGSANPHRDDCGAAGAHHVASPADRSANPGDGGREVNGSACRDKFATWADALGNTYRQAIGLGLWRKMRDPPDAGAVLAWIIKSKAAGWPKGNPPDAVEVIEGRLWEGNGKSAEDPLTPHQQSMKRLEDWFKGNEIRAPMNRQRKINHGTLGKWLKACDGNAGRAIGILDHCLGANKIGSTSSWGYVFTLMEAHGATGILSGNGGRRNQIRPQSSAAENRLRDSRLTSMTRKVSP